MGLFSKEQEPVKNELRSYIENIMYSIARDVKTGDNARISLIGKDKYIEECIDKLDSATAHIPSPLKEVEFNVHTRKNSPFGEVTFYFHVQGNSNVFQHLSKLYRLRGVLGIESRTFVYINYQEGQYKNAEELSTIFQNDIQILRQFLFDVETILEEYRHKLKLELNYALADYSKEVRITHTLLDELENLGFKPRQ